MPTYDYECEACQHKFEEFQSITAEALTVCPACGKPKLRRLFGVGAAMIFKGSGFYLTDYRSKSYQEGAKAEKTAASDSGKSADAAKSTAADSKAAAAPASTPTPAAPPAAKSGD